MIQARKGYKIIKWHNNLLSKKTLAAGDWLVNASRILPDAFHGRIFQEYPAAKLWVKYQFIWMQVS